MLQDSPPSTAASLQEAVQLATESLVSTSDPAYKEFHNYLVSSPFQQLWSSEKVNQLCLYTPCIFELYFSRYFERHTHILRSFIIPEFLSVHNDRIKLCS